MNRVGLAGIVVTAALALPASTSAAGPFYASPSGAGATCSDTTPCDITTAVLMAGSGDTVLLKTEGATPYTLSMTLNNEPGETVAPAVAGTRPVLSSGAGVSVGVAGTLVGVKIDSTDPGSGRAVDITGAGLGRQLEIVVSGTGGAAVQLRDGGTLSDSTVWDKRNSAAAIVGGGTGGTARNVTAIASGATSQGFHAAGSFSPPGTNQVDAISNSILRGTDKDLVADNAIGDMVTVNIDHSNYVTTVPPPAEIGVTITDSGGRQTGAPAFASAATGDFHQLLGSTTIDAGGTVGGLGPFDLDGGPRVVGSAPDIGADEFQPAAAPQTPSATAVAAAPKCKAGFKLKTVKNKKGKKKKKCVRKRRRRKK